ncbi:MAG: hemerythrin domain-containing protein [Paludibacter sp.]
MKATEDLMNEHKAIRVILTVMSTISDSIKNKKVFYTNDVEKIVDFLSVYTDKCHRTKEEAVFYPALLLTKHPLKEMSVGLLINEHSIGKGYLDEITCCVENCKLGSSFSGERIADCMANYVQLLDSHIQKEEDDYFPLANKAFSDEAQVEISKQFSLINDEFVGRDIHTRYDKLLKSMENKYLN